MSIIKHMHVHNFLTSMSLVEKSQSNPEIKVIYENFLNMFALTAIPVLDEVKKMIPEAADLLDGLREVYQEANKDGYYDTYMKPGLCRCPYCKTWEKEADA